MLTLDNHAFLGHVDTSLSITAAYTCSSLANRLLVVYVAGNRNSDDITGATYGGVAMTLVDKVYVSGDRYIYSFILLNPASGSNNVVISAGSSATIYAWAESWSGARQTSQPAQHSTNTVAPSTSISASVTTTVDKCWTTGLLFTAGSATLTPNAGTTKRDDDTIVNGTMIDSNGSITPPSSTSLGGSFASFNAGILIMSIAPQLGTDFAGGII